MMIIFAFIFCFLALLTLIFMFKLILEANEEDNIKIEDNSINYLKSKQ